MQRAAEEQAVKRQKERKNEVSLGHGNRLAIVRSDGRPSSQRRRDCVYDLVRLMRPPLGKLCYSTCPSSRAPGTYASTPLADTIVIERCLCGAYPVICLARTASDRHVGLGGVQPSSLSGCASLAALIGALTYVLLPLHSVAPPCI
ncbi:hypothetical protein EVJ58_g3803 [Rhodofomes roseus]|uniref:Uncharacterized protein n=1 Tax=Rhodofomes roseus TaxID=34475 RepID=A0A4Y9YM48_9APHY|nr:hypothetical protein EVJ58_g3803 [Rhodofomes roseus]